jgi:deoxyribonuclease V
MSAMLEPWNGDIAGARRLQAQLATQLVLEDDFPEPLRLLGGFDVGFEADGTKPMLPRCCWTPMRCNR